MLVFFRSVLFLVAAQQLGLGKDVAGHGFFKLRLGRPTVGGE
jgi:hypothetical protein